MRFKVGQKVRVVKPYSSDFFHDGEIVEIVYIGDDYGNEDCYRVEFTNPNISDVAGHVWYLNEDEVTPITNGEKIRAMSNQELADMLLHGVKGANCKRCPHLHKSTCTTENSCIDGIESWLNSPVEDKE